MTMNRIPAEELLDVIRVTQLERRAESQPRRMQEPPADLVRRDRGARVPGLRRLPIRGSAGLPQAAWRP